jgi:hypothetical protein
MNVILAGTIFAVVLSAGILVLLEIGRRIGVRQITEEGESASKGLGAIEGAIFGLLGLSNKTDIQVLYHRSCRSEKAHE